MLGEVFHLDGVKVAQSAVDSQEGALDTPDFHDFHQLTTEVQPRGRSGYSTFVLGIDGLEIFHVIGIGRTMVHDITGKWCLTQSKELALEHIVRTVIEEAQGAATAGGIVNHLCHHRSVVLKEELVADTDFAGGLHQHIPKAQLLIELTQKEHLNLGVGFFLGTIKTGGEHARIVEDEDVTLIKIVDDITEGHILGVALSISQAISFSILLVHVDGLALTVNHHQPAVVAAINLFHCSVGIVERTEYGFHGNLRLWQFEFELR